MAAAAWTRRAVPFAAEEAAWAALLAGDDEQSGTKGAGLLKAASIPDASDISDWSHAVEMTLPVSSSGDLVIRHATSDPCRFYTVNATIYAW